MRLVRVAALSLAAVTLFGAYAPSAGAATTRAATSGPRITLIAQPAFATVHDNVTMRVRIDGDPNRLSVQAAVHGPIGTRSGFDETLQGHTTRGATYSPLTKVADMRGVAGVYDMGLTAPAHTGVFPLDVTLYDGRTRVDGFTTYVATVPVGTAASGQMGTPLGLVWIWPFAANPAYLPNGTPDPAVVRALRPDGGLGRVASLLANTDLPVTVAPNPETVESLSALAQDDAQLAATLARLRRASKPALAGPYVPIDVPSLVNGGIRTEIGTQFAAGARALAAAGIQADRAVMPAPLDRAGLNQLAALGVDRLVVDPAELQPVPIRFTPARPFQLQADPHNVTAAVIDRALGDLLLQPNVPPALRAQQFLAGLAVVQSEQPGVPRAVVVAMPPRWTDDPSAVEAASITATALHGDPYVDVVAPTKLFDSVQPDVRTGTRHTPLVRQMNDAVRSGSPPVSAHDLRDARTRLDAFGRLVPADDPRVQRGERALLVSMSSVWTGAQGRRRSSQELAVIDASISQYARLISGPQQTTITITARRAAIPISFQNASSEPITVRVKLFSEKLFFPNGSEHLITLPPHNTTTRFAVETRASGTFPLTVTVLSADGGITFQHIRFTVRSTVVSGMGVFLTVGAGLFLAGWWANHYRRRRRAQRAARSSGSVPVLPAPESMPRPTPTGGAVR